MLWLADTTTATTTATTSPGSDSTYIYVIGGLTVLAGIALVRFYRGLQQSEFLERLLDVHTSGSSAHTRRTDAHVWAFAGEFLARRSEFWVLYGQFVLTALFVGVVGILLYANKVASDSALPVLSTVLGIVLGKTLLSARGIQGAQVTNPPLPPTNTTRPTITPAGTPKPGDTLSAQVGVWTGTAPINYLYQWSRITDETPTSIDSETHETYVVRSADIDSTLVVRVTAQNAAGQSAVTSPPTQAVAASDAGSASGSPTNTTPPEIQVGDAAPTVGAVVEATTGDWTPTPPQYGYQWRRTRGNQTDDIAGATASSYEPTDEDVGWSLVVAVMPLDDAGAAALGAEAAVSGPTDPVVAAGG